MSRGPGRAMRAIESLLPAYRASRGLSCRTLAQRVYGQDPSDAQVHAIARAAQRLVARGLAETTLTHDGSRVYHRAKGASIPAVTADTDPDAIVILDRSSCFARRGILAAIFIRAGRASLKLDASELCEQLQVSVAELREDINVLNVVNFIDGSGVLHAEIDDDGAVVVLITDEIIADGPV